METKCLHIIKAQGYWGRCGLELSKKLLDVGNQLSLFLQGLVKSSLDLFLLRGISE